MKLIEQIREQLRVGKYDLSGHAFKRAIERKILFSEIEEADSDAKIIEDYAEDKISPSCLLLGFTKSGKELHILVSKADKDYLKIITVYEPDEDIFDKYIIRR